MEEINLNPNAPLPVQQNNNMMGNGGSIFSNPNVEKVLILGIGAAIGVLGLFLWQRYKAKKNGSTQTEKEKKIQDDAYNQGIDDTEDSIKDFMEQSYEMGLDLPLTYHYLFEAKNEKGN
tara:strand:+ start:19329 stop:19685 length:357 start_codon:yes stop_codon:yes gene_type:complete